MAGALKISRVLALLLFTACVGRDLSKDRFACGSGGLCPDAAEVRPETGPDLKDSGTPADLGTDQDTGAASADARADDAGLADAGLVDSGVIPPSCQGAIPLAANGLAFGDTTHATDNRQGSCAFQMGGHDITYSTGFPGDLSVFDVSTYGSSFDTVLYMFHNDCNVTSEFRCNDDRVPGLDLTSRIRVRNVGRGQYFMVVDGYDANAYGAYKLSVSGLIAAGEPCDPSLRFLSCEQGACLPDAVLGSRCKMPIDCSVNACQSPPVVTCPGGMSAAPSSAMRVVGAASSSRRIAVTGWSVNSAPASTLPFEQMLADTNTASVSFLLAGTYVLRYTAIDDLSQAIACDTTVGVAPDADLRVEAYWEPPDLALQTNLDLHVMSSTTPWFDATHDCYPADCTAAPLFWSAHDQGDAVGQGPEVIRVLRPVSGGTYRIGVHYVGSDIAGPAIAHVRVFCRGTAHELGMATLPTGNLDPNVDNSFWKVADVVMGASDCTVTKLADAMNNPLVVTASVAHRAR